MAGQESDAVIRRELSDTDRYLILAAAFLGWMFSGVQMATTSLVPRDVTTHFVQSGRMDIANPLRWENLFQKSAKPSATPPDAADVKDALKQLAPKWVGWFNCAFLLGAAFGGLVFGWVGDHFGRVKAMGLSIVWFSAFAGIGYFAVTPEQLLALRFLCAMGVGGMWPSGVSLASEAWSDVSRPMLSGLIGTAANVGIVGMAFTARMKSITPDDWRWTMLVGASPLVLGILVWAIVPESPGWLAAKAKPKAGGKLSILGVFRPPLLKLTLLGIALGAIPLLGGWGVTQWLIQWSDKTLGAGDPGAKAMTAMLRAGGGAIGSLLGGWIANLLGRRTTYFLISVTTLAMSELIYFTLVPGDRWFAPMVFAVGFISTIFFGWLPLYLPELFPTEARATGSGVSFNFGRILTAMGVLGTGTLTAFYHEDYAAAGKVTSLIYAAGMVVILFAPDTTGKKLSAEGQG